MLYLEVLAKLKGGVQEVFTLLPSGGGYPVLRVVVQKVSDPRFSHFVAPSSP